MSHPPEASRELAERLWQSSGDFQLGDNFADRWRENAVALIDAWVRVREAEVTKAKDAAYHERDMLVCALSKLFPSSLERHPIEDTAWEDDWRWIVFIDLPTGQVSWHIHDSEFWLFSHLLCHQGRKWDGHTTIEKYQRLSALATARKQLGETP